MTPALFPSLVAPLLVLAVQAAALWGLWSLRRAFVRQEDLQAHQDRQRRRERLLLQRLLLLEQEVRHLPTQERLHDLQAGLAALHGDVLSLNARMGGLEQLLERLERHLERQEDRLSPLSLPETGPLRGNA